MSYMILHIFLHLTIEHFLLTMLSYSKHEKSKERDERYGKLHLYNQSSEIKDPSVTFLISRLLATQVTILTFLVRKQSDPLLNILNSEAKSEKIQIDLIKLQDFFALMRDFAIFALFVLCCFLRRGAACCELCCFGPVLQTQASVICHIRSQPDLAT